MSKSTKGSIKFALLAYSVYCWADGSARIRQNSSSGSSFNINSLVTNESEPVVDRDRPSVGRLEALWAWIVRRGPPISEEEQSAIGKIDVATAFLLFNAIQRLTFPKRSASRPVVPSVTLPTPGVPSGLCWKTLILATALLSLLHETRRAAVLYYLRTQHANLTSQIQKDLAHMRIGQVLVRGSDVTPTSRTPEEEEEECLICSGAAETMSTSSHTGSSRGLGPLEAFCTNAPDKHLTHRSCFLRWHAAYIQQRPDRHPVSLIDNAPMQEAFIRAGIILRAAGFEYLLPRLKQTDEGQRDGERLEIHRHEQGSDQLLATLRTSAPPCPGCRSPVSLRFIDSRPPSSSPMSLVTPQPRLALAKFWREWAALVTGRTLTSYFGSLLSFMTVLAAITKARENSSALVVSFLG